MERTQDSLERKINVCIVRDLLTGREERVHATCWGEEAAGRHIGENGGPTRCVKAYGRCFKYAFSTEFVFNLEFDTHFSVGYQVSYQLN